MSALEFVGLNGFVFGVIAFIRIEYLRERVKKLEATYRVIHDLDEAGMLLRIPPQ